MNAVTVTPLEAYKQELLPPNEATHLWRALPTHIKPEVFERNLLNALMQQPKLMEYKPRLIYREVCKAAALGLLLDPQLGESYIIPSATGPQLRIGYRGMCKLARQAGDVAGIYAHEVCKNDHIVCSLGTEKKLDHRPELFGDRGPVVGYYAVIAFKDGTSDFEPMSVAQARELRDRSDAWKAFRAGKIKSTPWETDEIEMSKKTVLRRLLKRVPQSPELAEAIKLEDEAEYPSMRNVTPLPKSPPMPAEVDKIEQQRAVEIVEAGRDDGATVVWDEDGPPAPDTIEGDGIPGFLKRGSPKDELLAEIEKIEDMAGCFAFAQNLEARLAKVQNGDRKDVRQAFIARQAALNRD